MKNRPSSAGQQIGRYLVSWIVGVVVATAVIGGGLYFGLNMLDGSKPAPAVATSVLAPVVNDSAQAGVNAQVSVESNSAFANEKIQVDSDAQEVEPPVLVEEPEQQAVLNGAASAAQSQTPAKRKPVTRIAPRAPTTGGVAAARLPSGEEVLVLSGQRVDDAVAKAARERGITLPDEEGSSSAVVENSVPEELSDEEKLNLELLDEQLFGNEQGGSQDDGIITPRAPD